MQNRPVETAGYLFYEESQGKYTLRNHCNGVAYLDENYFESTASGKKYQCLSECPATAPFADDFEQGKLALNIK